MYRPYGEEKREGHSHIQTLGGGEEAGRVLLYAVPIGRGYGTELPYTDPYSI